MVRAVCVLYGFIHSFHLLEGFSFFFFPPYPGCGCFLATLIASPGMRYTQLRLPKFDSEVKDNSLWPLVVM